MRKKIVTSVLFTLLVFSGLLGNAHAATLSQYVDFNSKKWWNNEVKWGLEQQIITGYYEATGNGKMVWKIKPDNDVKEDEFLAMVLRRMAQSEVKVATKNAWWASAYYDVALANNLPTLSTTITKNAKAETPITRGRTARIAVKVATGELMTEREAVDWLYSIGFEGKSATVKTFASYDPNGKLTRAEAVTFIKRLSDKGYTELVTNNESGEVPEVISIK